MDSRRADSYSNRYEHTGAADGNSYAHGHPGSDQHTNRNVYEYTGTHGNQHARASNSDRNTYGYTSAAHQYSSSTYIDLHEHAGPSDSYTGSANSNCYANFN